jgi:hypothetical protein
MKILILTLFLLLAGCGVSPSEVGDNEFDPSKVAYFKDARTEVCFAIVSYSRVDSNGRLAGGLSQSVVPCTPPVEKLLRNQSSKP